MKRSFPLLLLLVFLIHSAAYGAFFKWTDEHGVVHFTDNRNKIPKKYRKQAKKVTILEDSSPAKAPQQAAPVSAQPAPAPQAPTPGGHDQLWWRQRFANLRAHVQVLQNSISEKNTRLAELRRKRSLYFRAQDRVAINEVQDSITADEAKLSDTIKQLDELDQQANTVGVPPDWRQ